MLKVACSAPELRTDNKNIPDSSDKSHRNHPELPGASQVGRWQSQGPDHLHLPARAVPEGLDGLRLVLATRLLKAATLVTIVVAGGSALLVMRRSEVCHRCLRLRSFLTCSQMP